MSDLNARIATEALIKLRLSRLTLVEQAEGRRRLGQHDIADSIETELLPELDKTIRKLEPLSASVN